MTTIFPEYDWVKNVLGNNPANAEVTMLLNNGTDLHGFQPTADDIMKLTSCDLFIYVGGESDGWVEDAVKTSKNNKMTVLNLLDILGDSAKQEEIIEGMQKDEHDHEDEEDIDEHVWLSLKNAEIFVNSISDALSRIDSAHADEYKANAAAYTGRLKELDKKYKETVSNAATKTLIFADRFPFRYLVDDYGLSYYAAFAGCSAETEASFQTITFLSEKIDELSLHSMIVIDGSDGRIAATVISTTSSKDQKILTLNSMQSITKNAVEEGTSYLSVMEKNLEVLKEALNNA